MSQSTEFTLDFIRHLLSATTNASLFGMGHPQVVRLTSRAFDSLLKALENRRNVSLVIIENELVIDGQPYDFSLLLDRFVQTLNARGIGHITLLQGITQNEITELVAVMARQGTDAAKAIRSSEHFRLSRVDIAAGTGNGRGIDEGSCGSDGSVDSHKPAQVRIPEMPAEEMDRLIEIYETVKYKQKFKITGILEIVSGFIDAFQQEGRALLVLAALRKADAYTFTHSTNVCILNLTQAMALGIEGQFLNDIGVAGMLHDIGKLFIPEELLMKKDKLTQQEVNLIQTHPVRGARYLLESPGVPRLAIVNAFEHHLRYDLSGYPKVPPVWKQNICSQMTTISDFYDAMRTPCSYREALDQDVIKNCMLDILGSHLHPALTHNFLQIISGFKDQ